MAAESKIPAWFEPVSVEKSRRINSVVKYVSVMLLHFYSHVYYILQRFLISSCMSLSFFFLRLDFGAGMDKNGVWDIVNCIPHFTCTEFNLQKFLRDGSHC